MPLIVASMLSQASPAGSSTAMSTNAQPETAGQRPQPRFETRQPALYLSLSAIPVGVSAMYAVEDFRMFIIA